MKSTATANPVMTGHAVQFMRSPAGFVGLALFPAFSSGIQSSDYYVWDRANALNIPQNIRHAPGAGFARTKMQVSDDAYNCKDYGIESPVPDETRKKYANAFNADLAAVKRNVDIIRVNHEIRVKTLATGGSVPTAAVAQTWNNDASKPKQDVDAVKEIIRKNCGLRPNVMQITEAHRLRLIEHPVIADRIKYTSGGNTSLQQLAAYFEIDRIVIAEQVINSAAEGQAITPADIWGTDVILAHVNNSQDLSVPTFGRTFYWSEFGSGSSDVPIMIETYRDETVASDIHRSRHFTDEKIVFAEAGYRLTGALA